MSMLENKGFEILINTVLKAMGFQREEVEQAARGLAQEGRERIEKIDGRIASIEKDVAEIKAIVLQIQPQKESP